ncbi:hypothetical protein B0H17DRAFT_1202694 [Mycena rosella]|uniref:Uncharacterized protein n=1 Tax=Mycena rosella TaxID=1033263 RepID=A0AAD7DF66_MYCRO|nr:hypothetical protein B0H17DRAFT_1202694 [Mycena rosella]
MSNSTASRAVRYEARAVAAAAKDGDLNLTPTKSTQSAPAWVSATSQVGHGQQCRFVLQVASRPGGGRHPAPIVTSDRYGPPKCGRPSGHVLSASMQPSGTRLETVSPTPEEDRVRRMAEGEKSYGPPCNPFFPTTTTSTPPGSPPHMPTIMHSPRINLTLNARLNARLNSLPNKLCHPNARPNTRPKKIYPHMTASGGNAPCGPPSGDEDDADDEDDNQAPPIATLGSPPPSPPPEDDDPELDAESAVDQLEGKLQSRSPSTNSFEPHGRSPIAFGPANRTLGGALDKQRAACQPHATHCQPRAARQPCAACHQPHAARCQPRAARCQPRPLVVNPAPLVVNPAPLVVNPAPLVVNPAPLVVNPAPLVVNPAPPVDPAPLVINPAPPIDNPTPPIVNPAPPVVNTLPVVRAAPSVNPMLPINNPAPLPVNTTPPVIKPTLPIENTPPVINPDDDVDMPSEDELPPFTPYEPADDGDVDPDSLGLDFPQGLLSFEEEDEGKEQEEEEEESDDKGWVDENDGSAPVVLRNLGMHAERNPHAVKQPERKPQEKGKKATAEQKTAALKEGQLKARREGMKQAVETLHKYVKKHAEKIAQTFGLSKAEVHGVIMSATKLKRPQTYHKFNAKVWWTCRERNTGKPKGERISMMEGRAIVAAQSKGDWTQAQLNKLKHDWMVEQASKKAGTRKTNAEAAKDVTLTGDRIFEELLLLEKRTGLRGFCVIAGSHASDTIRSSVIGSVDSVRFLPDIFHMDLGTFATKYRNWACFDADVAAEKEATHPGKKVYVSATLRDKLREATGKPRLDVQFLRYDELMRGKEGYEIVGWPDDVPICAPSKMGVGGSAAIDILYERLKNGECYWRAIDPAVRTEINKAFLEAGKKKKPRKTKPAAKADDSDDAEETEEEEEAPRKKRKRAVRKKPAVSEDKEEEEALPKKKKAAKRKRAQEEEEEEEEARPRKKAAKKKKAAAVEDEEEEAAPKKKVGKKVTVKGKEKAAGEKRKRDGADDSNAAPAKRVPFKHLRAKPPAGRSASIVPSDADITGNETAPAQSSSTAAAASTSVSTSKSTPKTGWESVRVTDEMRQISKDAADRMKRQIEADRKAGTLPPARPKPKPRPTAKSLQEIADLDYGSSSEEE